MIEQFCTILYPFEFILVVSGGHLGFWWPYWIFTLPKPIFFCFCLKYIHAKFRSCVTICSKGPKIGTYYYTIKLNMLHGIRLNDVFQFDFESSGVCTNI